MGGFAPAFMNGLGHKSSLPPRGYPYPPSPLLPLSHPVSNTYGTGNSHVLLTQSKCKKYVKESASPAQFRRNKRGGGFFLPFPMDLQILLVRVLFLLGRRLPRVLLLRLVLLSVVVLLLVLLLLLPPLPIH